MGRPFHGVLGRLGLPTGDGRIISPGGLASRDLPLPLSWQRESGDGHGGSTVVARIETLQFHEDMVTYTGHMLDVSDAWEAEVLIEAGVIGPSMDLDDLDYVVDDQDRVIITSARVAGATLVAIPAFAEVSINLDPLPARDMERVESAEDVAWLAASAAVTAAPPLEYFARPAEVGPVTVDGDRVSGYVGLWGSCHIGMPGCTTMPSSPTNYSQFLLKNTITADGSQVPTGVISVGPGHADPKLGLIPAMAHYDDPANAVAKVFAAEDEHGLWVSGYVLPYADPVKVQQLTDLQVSGDWREKHGALELIAVCAVNTPGFSITRKVHFSLDQGQRTLIGRFNVQPKKESDPGPVVDDARAAWARANWKAA